MYSNAKTGHYAPKASHKKPRRSEVMLTCLSRHVLGLNGRRKGGWRWLCFDVIQDLVNYVWVSDVSDDTHSSATQRAEGNIKPSAARSKTLLSR